MAKDLLIMKHGNVKRGFYKGDQSYELKDKGKRNAQRIGVWLESNDLVPDYVIYSTAEYARTSTEKTCKAAGVNLKQLQSQECSYAADQDEIIDVIKKTPQSANRLLVVGHNPVLESVLSILSKDTIEKTKKGKVLTPATLVHFKIDSDWSKIKNRSAELIKVVYPKKLPELFPFPDINGSERRVRPAYYYNQSSVIPYRFNNDQLEILIISSSQNKHWVVPKGIHDPGLTAQQSASKEAFEEAGIKGDVHEKEIARYQYTKWEATCTVSVYLMKVSSMLTDDEWAESNRRRTWVNVDEASKLIHNSDLAKVIRLVPDYLEQEAV